MSDLSNVQFIPKTSLKDNYIYQCSDIEEMKKLPILSCIPDFIQWFGQQYASLPVFTYGQDSISYSQFVSRIKRRIQWIQGLNLKPQSNIGLIANNNLDVFELFFAIPASGHVAVIIQNHLNEQELCRIVHQFHIRALFSDKIFSEPENISPCRLFPMDKTGSDEAPLIKIEPQQPAAIFFTTGSTGKPKGVVLSHQSLVRGGFNASLLSINFVGKKTITTLPLHHIFGAVYCLLGPLYKGQNILICSDFKQSVSLIPVFKPHILSLVPGMLKIILSLANKRGKAFLGDLELVYCGGASVPVNLQQACKDLGVTMWVGYGLTESTAISIGNKNRIQSASTSGKLFPEMEAKIIDGELWLRGDNIMLGYYEDPESTAEVMKDGWLNTGDLFKLDDEDNLVLIGRSKNLIVLSNGENVSPEEIENIYSKSPMIDECLVEEVILNGNTVLGIEIYPNQNYCSGFSKDSLYEKLNALRKEINAALPSYKQISKLIIKQEPFEKTPSMKIMRKGQMDNPIK